MKQRKDKEPLFLFSVTAKDCEWSYFRGSGKGGQKRNKTSNAVRVYHPLSGAMGKAEDTRSQKKNKQLAFKRMVESEKFQKWLKLEIARVTGELRVIKEKVERELNNPSITKVEVRINGKWQEAEL